MLAVNGFVWNDLLNLETPNPVTEEIKVYLNHSLIYQKEINKYTDHMDLIKIINEIKIIIYENKNDDLFIANFIEFIIWVDKQTNYHNIFLTDIMKECIEYANKIDFIDFCIRHKENVEKYDLFYIIDTFWSINLRTYNFPELYDSLFTLCDVYQFNYKEKLFCLLQQVLKYKSIEIIDKNFEYLSSEDIYSLVVFANNKENFQEKYKQACVFKQVLDSIMN